MLKQLINTHIISATSVLKRTLALSDLLEE